MPRLGRWTLNALTVFSLLLCAATVAVWVRSSRRVVQGQFTWRGERCRAYVWHGCVGIDNALQEREYNMVTALLNRCRRLHQERADLGATARRIADSPLGRSSEQWSYLDTAEADERVAMADEEDARQQRAKLRFEGPWSFESRVAPPAVAVLTLALPGVRFIRAVIRRARGRAGGRCITCGYDLTANVSGICPECGTAIRQRRA